MTQVQTLKTGKWASDLATAEEMAAKVQEVKAIVEKYGWGKSKTMPYGFAITIDEFLTWFGDYDRCTHSSKQMHLSEINGLIKIINKWIEREEQPKITIRFLTGKKAGQTKQIPESDADIYIGTGWAEKVG